MRQSVQPDSPRDRITGPMGAAMRRWIDFYVRSVFMIFGLLAPAGVGWSALRTALLPP